MGKVTRGQGEIQKYKDTELLLRYERAGGGLAPELVNIDHVFANTSDGDF